MRDYEIVDAEGRKRIIEQDDGVIITIMLEPSSDYLDKWEVEFEADDLGELDLMYAKEKIKEIDDLKTRIEKLESSRL